MSYMTIMPNAYYNSCSQITPFANQYLANQNVFNAKNVLNYLQSALRISLSNYQLNYQQTAKQEETCPLNEKSEKLTQQDSPNSLELIQSHEENKEIAKINNQVQEKIIPSIIPPIQEKESKKEPQSLTDDEFLLQDKEKTLKKNQIPKRKGKKVKEDPMNEFVVSIPKVDLIESAALPSFSLAYADICKKREEILMRKVGDWSDFIKTRKDKRQIRMLSN